MKKKENQSIPKLRKRAYLWQAYLRWNELMQMRKRHLLRLSAIERGASEMSDTFERDIIDELNPKVDDAQSTMIAEGELAGPIWDWLVGIKGIGDHTAAKLLALFNDVAMFPTVSKFWRFSGWAVIDGEIDYCKKGEKSPYNRRLKAECFLVAENFVLQQTPVYVDIYYEEKERQRQLHPVPICSECGTVAVQRGQSWVCPECKANKRDINFTPLHLDYRAKRKMIKIFLQHFWLKWREFEGLPVSGPYVQDILGHTGIIKPCAG